MTTLCKYLSTYSALRNIILKHLSWYSNIHTVKMIQIIILNMRMNFFQKYTSPTKCKVISNSFLDISESPQFILFKACCTFGISWCSQLILSIFHLKEILGFFSVRIHILQGYRERQLVHSGVCRRILWTGWWRTCDGHVNWSTYLSELSVPWLQNRGLFSKEICFCHLQVSM